MTRPLTCLTLICAAGAGLYLYQEKHQARMVDREINQTVHATEQTRDRIGMMRAEWAMLNEPDRLTNLATAHLTLQSMVPGQFVQLADLGNHLPPVGAPTAPPADIEPPAPPPVAAATPVPGTASKLMAQSAPRPEPGKPAVLAQNPPSVTVPSLLAPKLPRTIKVAAAKPREPEPVYHPVYAPVMQAFASQAPVQQIRPPSVQQAAAGLPSQSYAPPPYVGSALGMARTSLSAPIPVASATTQ